MLIYSITVSMDGYVADRDGDFNWTQPSEDLLQFHLEQVSGLGAYLLGRRLYETMLVWETDPSLRDTPGGAAFADVWAALPKIVFSRTLASVQGTARLAERSLADEIAEVAMSTDRDVSIGGAMLAAEAIELDLLDELRVFRDPTIVGGGTPHLPPVADPIRLELIESRVFDSRVVFERARWVR